MSKNYLQKSRMLLVDKLSFLKIFVSKIHHMIRVTHIPIFALAHVMNEYLHSLFSGFQPKLVHLQLFIRKWVRSKSYFDFEVLKAHASWTDCLYGRCMSQSCLPWKYYLGAWRHIIEMRLQLRLEIAWRAHEPPAPLTEVQFTPKARASDAPLTCTITIKFSYAVV